MSDEAVEWCLQVFNWLKNAQMMKIQKTASVHFKKEGPFWLPFATQGAPFVIVTLMRILNNLALHLPLSLHLAPQLVSEFSIFLLLLDIRIQQRNGRKTLTTVQGIPKEMDPFRILKALKKVFACNGTVVEDEVLGSVLQLQGDHRVKIQNFLIEENIATKDGVKIHGF
jgi:translation initiation factor 1